MPPLILDIFSECHYSFFGSWKRKQKFKFCDILCHIIPDLNLYFEMLRIHCNVQITNIVFSSQNQDVIINKEFLKDRGKNALRNITKSCVFLKLYLACPLWTNALVFPFEFNISNNLMSCDGLRLDTQWTNNMYWVFLNILISFLCWNDDFSKKINFR